MAKEDFSLTFKNCFVNLEDKTITEVDKDGEQVFDLNEVLEKLEGKQLNISFRESVPYKPNLEEY